MKYYACIICYQIGGLTSEQQDASAIERFDLQKKEWFVVNCEIDIIETFKNDYYVACVKGLIYIVRCFFNILKINIYIQNLQLIYLAYKIVVFFLHTQNMKPHTMLNEYNLLKF